MKVVFLILCLAVLHQQVLAANLLVLFPHIYYSHFKQTSNLVSELSAMGFDITFVGPYTQEFEGYENIKTVSIDGIIEPVKKVENEFLKNDNHWGCYWSKLKYTEKIGYEYAQQILHNENFTKLISTNSSKPFDLVIIEDVAADGLAVLSYVFKSPLIVLLSEPMSLFYDNYITDNTVWKQFNELRNAHHWVLKELYREWFIIPQQNHLVKEIAPEAPDLRRILYKTSLILMPSYPTLGNLMPKYSNVKQIGGFHITGSAKKSSYEIEVFFNASTHGVIVISKNVQSFVENRLTMFFEDRVDLRQDILFTSDVSEVIGNSKVKLLIGDGDVYDTGLAVLNQVPILTISTNRWQQQFLVDALVEKRIASQVPVDDIGSEMFVRVIDDILMNNDRYKEKLKEASEIIISYLTLPLEEATNWIDYTMRFNGAPHLRPCKLRWSMKNHLIVIIIVLTVIDVALFLLFYWLIKHFPHAIWSFGRKMYQGVADLFRRNTSRTEISYIKL